MWNSQCSGLNCDLKSLSLPTVRERIAEETNEFFRTEEAVL